MSARVRPRTHVFRSLRFKLPAIFLAGIALAGLVASLIAFRLFQDYVLDRARAELRREAIGLTQLYTVNAGDIPIPAGSLERATGDRLYYIGLPLEFLDDTGENEDSLNQITRLPPTAIPPGVFRSAGVVSFEFVPPGEDHVFLAVGAPVKFKKAGDPRPPQVFGTLVVAKPRTELDDRLSTLVRRLTLAFLGGIAVAALLAAYLSRRITRPVLELSHAADEIAEGRYAVDVAAARGDDEIGHLSRRFQEMAERLRETEELERNFLMSVSHELRTPLTAIRGHVEALREGLVEDPELRAESLDVVAAETERLGRLVGDVLDLAKLDARRFTVHTEEVAMERLLQRAYASFTEEARRRAIEYKRDVRAEPVIVTDGDRVLQIITNLLTNAFRWTPDGGRIGLELAAENGSVSVAVADSGPGIEAHERERVFRPFWSRDGAGGTGLGLAIANELALALGGRIELRSEPGRGSRFELVLPARRT